MTRLILDVDEDRYNELVNYLKSLDYVNISDSDYEIPEWQKKETLSRLEETPESDYLTIDQLKEKIKQEK